jgi:hypothetical protein
LPHRGAGDLPLPTTTSSHYVLILHACQPSVQTCLHSHPSLARLLSPKLPCTPALICPMHYTQPHRQAHAPRTLVSRRPHARSERHPRALSLQIPRPNARSVPGGASCPARPFHGGEAEAVRGGGAGTAAAGLTFMSGGRLTPLTRPEDAPARRKSRPRAASPRQLPRRRAQHAGPWAGPGGLGAWPRAGPVRAGHEACVGVGGAAVSGWGQ